MVHLKRGFFWYYLQQHDQIPQIDLQHEIPSIIKINLNSTDLIRLSIRENVISLDFSHILTDGNGGFRFLLGLIYEYLRCTGVSISNPRHIPDPNELISSSEAEDAHRKYFPGNLPHPEKLSAAYHLRGKPSDKYQLLSAEMPLKQILSKARENNVSITTYLSALYIYSLNLTAQKDDPHKDPTQIRLQVPVDMRQFYPSNTMRNFSLYVSPEIDTRLGNYSFEDILEKVDLSIKLQANRKELSRQISRNVGGELNPVIRIVPRFLKNLYLAGLYSRLGERCYSGVLSNVGAVKIEPAAQKYINAFDIAIIPNFKVKKSCAVFSYADNLNISFCSVIKNRDLERFFFSHLTNKGINVKVKEYK